MKITWEPVDIVCGRQVVDKAGYSHVITYRVEPLDKENTYGICDLRDGLIWVEGSRVTLAESLNNAEMIPVELKGI